MFNVEKFLADSAEITALHQQIKQIKDDFIKSLMSKITCLTAQLNARAVQPTKKKKSKKITNESDPNLVLRANASHDQPSSVLQNQDTVLANADSGASGTYLRVEDIRVLTNVQESNAEQLMVAVATGTLIRSTHHGYLNIPGHGPIIVHVFPALKGSLLSISQLVDLGLRVSYCKRFITATNTSGDVIILLCSTPKERRWRLYVSTRLRTS